MHSRKRLVSFFFIILSMLVFAEMKVQNSKNLIKGELENGMKYYIYKNTVPKNRVAVNVLVRAGSLQEDEDQLGLAHLIEHLCFNGTEKYEKNEVIKYYQSIGMNFGGDLNAHTGFDETVYKIQIPTDNKKLFEKGIEVLEEMTLKPVFKQQEIDSEKFVVQEEWRLGQGLSDRITKILKKEIFGESRYGKRFPIGEMDIVLNTKRDVLKRFYDKWYNPKNMAVVMVGDIDTEYAKKVVKKYFNVENKKKFIPRKEYKIEKFKDKYVVFKDKELTYVLFEMSAKRDINFKNQEEKMIENYKNMIFNFLFKNRINEKIKEGKNIIFDGGFQNEKFSSNRLDTFYVFLNRDNIKSGIEESFFVLKDIAFNGITEEELELEKENIKSIFTNALKNRNALTSNYLIGKLDRLFLNDELFIEFEDNLKYYNELSKKITVKDINKFAKSFYKDKKVSLLFVPDDKNIKVPTEKELKDIIKDSKQKKIKKRKLKGVNLVLISPKINSGKVINITEFKNYKKIKLSNGLEFLYKRTNFEDNKIYIKLYKNKGNIKDSKKMYLNSEFINVIENSGVENIEYEDLDRFMKSKEFSLKMFINNFSSGMIISSNKKDLNTALNYFTYLVKEPKFSKNAFNYTISSIKDSLENRLNSPVAIYSDKIKEIFFNNDYRRKNITLEDLNFINKMCIVKEYKDKFENFYGYRGIIVGAIEEKELLPILEKYFASLPVKTKKEICKKEYLDIKYPKGIKKIQVVKGIDKKALVSIIYPVNKKYTEDDRYKAKAFENILKIELTDEIREKLGGVYGIEVKLNFLENENSYLKIQFSTDPKRVEEMSEAVKKEIEKLVDGNIKKASLMSIVKNYKLSYENNQEKNIYWLSYLEEKIKQGEKYELYSPSKYEEVITKENLKPFFDNLINKENYIEAVLIPEKEEK